MTRHSHIWVGFLSSIAMYNPLQSLDKRLALILVGSCMIGSIAPDFDMHWAGFRQKTQSYVFNHNSHNNLLNSHRGWTHHIFLPIILTLIALTLPLFYKQMLMAFVFGMVVHIVTDMFSPMGIPVFKNKDRASFPLYKTGQSSEFLFVAVLSAFMFLIFVPKLGYSHFIHLHSFLHFLYR